MSRNPNSPPRGGGGGANNNGQVSQEELNMIMQAGSDGMDDAQYR